MKVPSVLTVALTALIAHRANAAFPASVASLMDTTVDPCENFYEYSCGGWLKNTSIPVSKSSVDTSFSVVGDQAELVIQQIINEKYPYISEFWNACINTDLLDKLGAKPLEKELNRVVDAVDRAEVLSVGGQLSRTSASFLTDIDVSMDLKNASMNALYVGSASLTLPSTGYYLDNETMSFLEPSYKTYIKTVLQLAGFGPDGKYKLADESANQGQGQQQQKNKVKLTLDQIADRIVALEKDLAPIAPNGEESEDPLYFYNPITIAEAKRKYPLTFSKYALGVGLLTKSTLTPQSTIIFNSFDYHNKLEALVAKTPLSTLKAYLAFSYINKNVRLLSDPFYAAYFEFFAKTLNGQKARSPRPSICVYREQQYLPDLIGKYYFEKMFDQVREENAKLMVTLIESAMADHIARLTWLDDATRVAAKAKLDKFIALIGHSTEPVDFPFKLNNDEFFNNVMKVQSFNFDVKMKKAGQAVNRNHWEMSAAEVNAYYSPLENKIVFPAAILQPPFFNGTSHPAQNFGAIGAVVGHELTHGFDSSGRLFDGDGNARNWWTEATTKEFDARAQCMKDQYSTIEVIGEDGKVLTHVNGNTTITENIADNGGASLSLDALHAFVKTATNVATNGVLPEESDKLFFVSFAQVWCSKERDGAILQQLATDPHSPGVARTNGVAMNSDAFAATFQCKAGSKMNPIKKCQLW